jgi:hypothetical protein
VREWERDGIERGRSLKRIKVDVVALVAAANVVLHVVLVLAPLRAVIAAESWRFAALELDVALKIRVVLVELAALLADVPHEPRAQTLILRLQETLVAVYPQPWIACNLLSLGELSGRKGLDF